VWLQAERGYLALPRSRKRDNPGVDCERGDLGLTQLQLLRRDLQAPHEIGRETRREADICDGRPAG
jgi:hypothetical protein